MSWFVFTLISVIALAAAEILQQRILNKEKIDEAVSAFITFFTQAIVALLIILLSKDRYRLFDVFDTNVMPYMLLGSILATFGLMFYMKSFKVKNISISVIFISLSAVVSTVMGILILNETTDIWKYIGIGLVLLSIIILNSHNFSLEKSHAYGLLAGIFFGMTYTIDKFVVKDITPLVYLFWSFLLTSIIVISFNTKRILKHASNLREEGIKYLFLSAFGYMIYNLCTFIAYTKGGEVGRVDAINNAQVFSIILFEYIFLKQRKDIWKKLITATIAFAGILLLGYL